MSNNMDLGYEMFCYQCEQTAGGKGCTKQGVCGKTAEVANLQDLLLYQLKGISVYAKALMDAGENPEPRVVRFVENCLFTTLTNVNFDAAVHVDLLKQSQKIKEELRGRAKKARLAEPKAVQAAFNLPETKSEMLRVAAVAGIMYEQDLDPDVRSLCMTILYGLKGISAYGHQARELGYASAQVDAFYLEALSALTDDALSAEELIRLTMRTGEIALAVMKTLDEANTGVYGDPAPHKVKIHMKKGPFIVVSGHDLKDLEMLLAQTQGKGIHVYTHGEMLPAHGYEGLKKYTHLVGNFGGAWQDQQSQFDDLPGCILMTTNCLMRPRESYKDRIFSTNVVGWDGVQFIEKKENGFRADHQKSAGTRRLSGRSRSGGNSRRFRTSRSTGQGRCDRRSGTNGQGAALFPNRGLRRCQTGAQLLYGICQDGAGGLPDPDAGLRQIPLQQAGLRRDRRAAAAFGCGTVQ